MAFSFPHVRRAHVTRSSLAFIVSPLISGSVSGSLLLMILCTSYGVFSWPSWLSWAFSKFLCAAHPAKPLALSSC